MLGSRVTSGRVPLFHDSSAACVAVATAASFVKTAPGIACRWLGDTSSMAAEIVEDGGRNVLVVRYSSNGTHNAGIPTEVDIALAQGSAGPQNVTSGALSQKFGVAWDGLAAPVPHAP